LLDAWDYRVVGCLVVNAEDFSDLLDGYAVSFFSGSRSIQVDFWENLFQYILSCPTLLFKPHGFFPVDWRLRLPYFLELR
jgi:hypothetical protein